MSKFLCTTALLAFLPATAMAQADMSCADYLRGEAQMMASMSAADKATVTAQMNADPTAADLDKKVKAYCAANPKASSSEAMMKAMQ